MLEFEALAADAAADSPRACPLCMDGACTPRHLIVPCRALAAIVDAIRDDLEHREGRCPRHDGCDMRFPAVLAWGWAVPLEVVSCTLGGMKVVTVQRAPWMKSRTSWPTEPLCHWRWGQRCATQPTDPDLAERPVEDGRRTLQQAGKAEKWTGGGLLADSGRRSSPAPLCLQLGCVR